MEKIELTEDHCREVMQQELMIGRDKAKDGKSKQFGFHVWDNEYRVTHDGKVLYSGQAIEDLLSCYNNL